MKQIRKCIQVGMIFVLTILSGCSKPATGALSAPEYTNELSGVAARFDDGTVILLTEAVGPIILSGNMSFDKLKSGDHLTIYTDDIMESYPAQADVKEMILHKHGEITDLPSEQMHNLLSLGYQMKEYEERTMNTYQQITMSEAKERFETPGDYIILDVRRADEFADGHIPGAVNIANESISSVPPSELPDLNQTIYVYCRSGNRSKQAAEKLVKLGYTGIIEFGGILSWTGEIEQ